ncbi:MAG: hypothetical protein ACAF41_13830 [Leptolyngbya sp. BL-A-14]
MARRFQKVAILLQLLDVSIQKLPMETLFAFEGFPKILGVAYRSK